MLRNEGEKLTRVVVSSPVKEYFQVDNLKQQNINEIADREQTLYQHNQLKNIMYDFGCEVIDIPELEGHPNSVFTRDVALTTPEGFIQLRMGLDARRSEEKWMAQKLRQLGEKLVGEIVTPGIAEGGDIILAGNVAFIGLSHRTNQDGIDQLTQILEKMDYEVRLASVQGSYLHIGGAMSAIGPRRIMHCKDVFPNDFFNGFDIIEVPHRNFKPSVGNVICLQENEVVANVAENLEAIQILEANGVKVHRIDLSEFRKGAGGPTCMILPIERK